ncbi:CIA30 family protein [Flavobacterium sp.]|uniref:CIA30 family protein n=1 Tax=Flavobacterium sp. TaxID=239 RepID=UPI004048E19D
MTMIITNNMLIFDFNKLSNISDWRLVNDVVMGGRSTSEFYLNEEGYGVFAGNVSLENNGGFSFLRYRFDEKNIEGFKKVILRLKGDEKEYQFRAKSNQNSQESYKKTFKTTGEWQTIEISLSELQPIFRGQKLNIPNFSSNKLEEIGFLIGNKKNESFKLIIDTITLE